MAIQLSTTQYSNEDIERRILLNGGVKDSGNWARVCKLWDAITSDENFLRLILPPELRAIAGTHIKDFLIDHAVTSETAILKRFEKHLNKIGPATDYLFACYFPFHPDCDLYVRKLQGVGSWDTVDKGPIIAEEGIDYCVLINPFSESDSIPTENCDFDIASGGILECHHNNDQFPSEFISNLHDIIEHYECTSFERTCRYVNKIKNNTKTLIQGMASSLFTTATPYAMQSLPFVLDTADLAKKLMITYLVSAVLNDTLQRGYTYCNDGYWPYDTTGYNTLFPGDIDFLHRLIGHFVFRVPFNQMNR